jgi:hypothetical protein
MRGLGATLPPTAVFAMTREERGVRKSDLARALAAGISAKQWGEKHEVKKSTAYDWAKDPKVKAQVKSIRCRAADRAVGRLASRATWAAEGIVKLADDATSEAVRLSALRTVYSETREACNLSDLEDRVALIEERLDEGTENAS